VFIELAGILEPDQCFAKSEFCQDGENIDWVRANMMKCGSTALFFALF